MAAIKFTNIGMGNLVCANHVIAVIVNGTTTANRYKQKAKELGKYCDATNNKSLKSILLCDDGTVIASHISAATLGKRLNEEFNTNQPVDADLDYLQNGPFYDVDDEDDNEDMEYNDAEDEEDDDEE